MRKHCRQIKLLHVCALLLALVCAMKAAGQAFAPANTSTESKNNQSAEPRTGTRQYPYVNRLVRAKSPYLLLHAHNPVDWYPWGNEGFEKDRKENKPIFLSIGYFTCHWCHVMEKESYSDPSVTAILNQYFVSIKVDRDGQPHAGQRVEVICSER